MLVSLDVAAAIPSTWLAEEGVSRRRLRSTHQYEMVEVAAALDAGGRGVDGGGGGRRGKTVWRRRRSTQEEGMASASVGADAGGL
jgi:hypothetical protein